MLWQEAGGIFTPSSLQRFHNSQDMGNNLRLSTPNFPCLLGREEGCGFGGLKPEAALPGVPFCSLAPSWGIIYVWRVGHCFCSGEFGCSRLPGAELGLLHGPSLKFPASSPHHFASGVTPTDLPLTSFKNSVTFEESKESPHQPEGLPKN